MYLSRIEIDMKDRRKIKDLTHLGAFHNWVEQSFPEEINNRVRLRHLWRIDKLRNHVYLLVLSEDKPNLDLLSRYGVANTAETKNYDNFLNSLKEGQRLRFRLVANPTYKKALPGEKQGRVFPYLKIEDQGKWLVKKAEKNGFVLVHFDITEREMASLRRKGTGRVKLSQVSYEGLLEITDLDKFKHALVNGIGREKAYGMGLLTAIPVGE